jgi:ABC-type antimicrobial peptide transport system permease subunit
VGATSSVPLEDFGTGCSVVYREYRPYAVGEQTPCISTPIAMPGFFETMRIPVTGRIPSWSDVDARTHAVVITKALADRLWPGESPIGKGIGSNGPDSKVWYRIVGVTPAIKLESLDQPPTEAVFYAPTSLRNFEDGNLNGMVYMVRTNGVDPLSLTSAVRKIITEMNPRVPMIDARSMDAVVRRSMARISFMMVLLGVAASFALLLSAVGIYGVISYVVAQRRSEIGIRMALGASISQTVRLIMRQSMSLAVVGLTIGLAGAVAVNRLLQSMLFETSAADPVVLLTVTLGLLTLVAAASLVPARRAARIDPVEAIRIT